MEYINDQLNDGVLTISTGERIDSNNASNVESEIMEAMKQPHTALIIDFDNLKYISSAGLRVILRVLKTEKNLEVINVCSDVYEVLDMTGFTEMVSVKKAYRRLSCDGCEVIGEGANGIVYRLDPDTIIKVYKDADALDDIKRERELARKAFVSGIPTAIPYDVVRVGDTYGSVFELLNAKSFCDILVEDMGQIEWVTSETAELFKKLHSTEVEPEDMPDMKEVSAKWVERAVTQLPEEKASKLKKLFEDLPARHTIIHGDCQVKNIMVQNGEVLLIDMDTLCQGQPIFEFAGIYNTYLGYAELDHTNTERFLGIKYESTVELFHKTLAKYLGTEDPEVITTAVRKARLIGCTRLVSTIIKHNGKKNGLGEEHLRVFTQHILDDLDEIDTLEL